MAQGTSVSFIDLVFFRNLPGFFIMIVVALLKKESATLVSEIRNANKVALLGRATFPTLVVFFQDMSLLRIPIAIYIVLF